MTTTNNELNVPLSGNSGTVHFVGKTSPTLVTPTLGVSTATSIAFSPTTGGIIGTAAADNASTGYVGELVTSSVLYASRASHTGTFGVFYDVTSITLSAGDWNVYGNAMIINTGASLTAGTFWCNTSSVTQPDLSMLSIYYNPIGGFTTIELPTPMLRVNVSGSQNVYLSCSATAATTFSVCGNIYARRVR